MSSEFSDMTLYPPSGPTSPTESNKGDIKEPSLTATAPRVPATPDLLTATANLFNANANNLFAAPAPGGSAIRNLRSTTAPATAPATATPFTTATIAGPVTTNLQSATKPATTDLLNTPAAVGLDTTSVHSATVAAAGPVITNLSSATSHGDSTTANLQPKEHGEDEHNLSLDNKRSTERKAASSTAVSVLKPAPFNRMVEHPIGAYPPTTTHSQNLQPYRQPLSNSTQSLPLAGTRRRQADIIPMRSTLMAPLPPTKRLFDYPENEALSQNLGSILKPVPPKQIVGQLDDAPPPVSMPMRAQGPHSRSLGSMLAARRRTQTHSVSDVPKPPSLPKPVTKRRIDHPEDESPALKRLRAVKERTGRSGRFSAGRATVLSPGNDSSSGSAGGGAPLNGSPHIAQSSSDSAGGGAPLNGSPYIAQSSSDSPGSGAPLNGSPYVAQYSSDSDGGGAPVGS
ncbi:hypothetical protein F5Y18DRAFT_430444 [Xylariaceae sp. FL1019]|nr:hypothetical protein F5Y18DRAFT_430444 [Xylariaceae sp. FL1019]